MHMKNIEDSIYKAIIEQTTEAISIADLDGNYIFVNQAFCTLLGYEKDELLSKSVFDMKAPCQKHSSFQETINHKESLCVEVLLQKKDGTVFISEVIGKKIIFNNEEIVLGIVRDITYRVNLENSLKESEEKNYMVTQISNDGVWDWDMITNIVAFDERYYTLAGYKDKAFDYTFKEWEKRVHKDDLNNAITHFENYLSGKIEQYDVNFRFLKANGLYMWIRARGKIVKRDKEGNPLRFVGTHSNIDLQKANEEEIKHQAYYDSLTSLPNRLLSLETLQHQCLKASNTNSLLALLFIDLDDFKKINDTLGHKMGDEVLVETAKRLKKAVRKSDMVGRLGGDEFIIILENIQDEINVKSVLHNILKNFDQPFIVSDRTFSLGSSIGVAMYPKDGHTVLELLKNADTAMYHSKKEGRNRYSYYHKDMNADTQEKFKIEEEMQFALKNNEFEVYYQPKIDIKTNKIMGAEALIRWFNPTLGIIDPNKFISIAEQTGKIVEIGKFVLKNSLLQTSIWQKRFNKNFNIAINLSPIQFREKNLIFEIKKYLSMYNLSAKTLELEITEGVLLDGQECIKELLYSFSDLGIKLAMDDFGTGYSSLSYLKNYPFSILKIDKSFIENITHNTSDRELVKVSLSMSKVLNLEVVAEGVETQEQLQELRELGCDFAQGFLFNKALCAKDFTILLEKDTHYF